MPFLALLILNIPFKDITKKDAFWAVLALSALQAGISLFPNASFWDSASDVIGNFFKLNLAIDSLSIVLLFCIGTVTFITALVAKHFITDQKRLFNFTSLLLVILAGMNGIVMTRDIFSLYVFIEIAAIASFILIAMNKDIDAIEGAFKYLILSAIATTMMLSSIALILLMVGDTDLSVISYAMKTSERAPIIMAAIGLFICGLFIKGGLVPFHGWLPDAYSSASAPASVLLAGIVTKTVGIYTLMRIMISAFGFDNTVKTILMLVGTVSIVFGALAAIGQADFKRMLAYSSISQVGYIVLGLGCGTGLAIAGAAFHLFNHAMFKSLLFVNSASVELETKTRDMNKMTGFGQKMPVAAFTSAVATLSASGIPPLAGFWSKLIIVMALWAAGHYAYAAIAVLASVITLAYFLSMQRRVFFGKLSGELKDIRETAGGLVLSASILAAITIGAGVFFPFMLNVFILPIANMIGR